MIRIKEETAAKERGKSIATHAPYAFTSKVIPEVMYGNGRVTKKAVTKTPKPAKKVAKNTPRKGGDGPIAAMKASLRPPAGAQRAAGRPKVHLTSADRQRAYRARMKAKA